MNQSSELAVSRIDELLADVRMHLDRVLPENLDAEVVDGAVVVDTRPAPFRVAEGELPGALIVERNVLEWRFDPTSAARLPQATSDDVRVIVVCNDGYVSSLAARSLQLLGLRRATHLVGGYRAWKLSIPRALSSGERSLGRKLARLWLYRILGELIAVSAKRTHATRTRRRHGPHGGVGQAPSTGRPCGRRVVETERARLAEHLHDSLDLVATIGIATGNIDA